MTLAKNLKRLLSELDLSSAQLSRKSGVPRTTIAEWLSGGNPRDLKKVKQVANVLGLSVDELCFGDGSRSAKTIEQHLDEIRAGTFEVILRRPKQ